MPFQDWLIAHKKWKYRLNKFVSGQTDESLDPDSITRTDACALGQWILADSEKYAAEPEFATLAVEHAKFHNCAAEVVRCVQAGDRAKAAKLLAAGEEFDTISERVIELIAFLKNNYDQGL